MTVGPGGDSPTAFLKGAPEMVASFCLRESGTDLIPYFLRSTNSGYGAVFYFDLIYYFSRSNLQETV